MSSFSKQHPQFLTLNNDPYTHERMTSFGVVDQHLKTQINKPTSKLAVSLTGEHVTLGFGPSQHLHKMQVLKPSQSGVIVGSGSLPFVQSDL
jgi:hypothetical protein